MLNNIKGCAEALRETAPEIDILINEPPHDLFHRRPG